MTLNLKAQSATRLSHCCRQVTRFGAFTHGLFVCVASLLFCLAPLSAVTVPLPELSLSGEVPFQTTVTLPAGADFLRVSGDWSATLGTPESRDLELTVIGPGEISAFLPVFSNAAASSTSVAGLQGELRLTSVGGAGDYSFSFLNKAAGSVAALLNGSVELLTLQEELSDSATLGLASPTFNRPEENGSPSGRTTRYASYQFTPNFSGSYIITSQQVGFDGLIALYSGDQNTAPFSGFIAANDDSAAGESFSRLEVTLTAGQSYTLVTTSYSTSASGSFTNRIRSFTALSIDTSKATTFGDYAEQRGFTGGPEADDSGNGLSNLLEYALGRDADSPVAAPLETSFQDGSFVGRFYRDPDLTDITYILEASSDLETWEVLYNSSTDLQPNADGAFQEIEDSEPVNGNRFLRLRIVLGTPKALTYADYADQQGLGEPSADDNNNGLANLLEYALGRTSESPYSAPLETSPGDGFTTIRFYRDPELTDITYIIEYTSDFSEWIAIYNSSIDSSPNADGDYHQIQDTIPPTGVRLYRLRVVLGTPKPVTYSDYASMEGLGAPSADDNDNGLANLLEYALGRTEDSPLDPPLETFVRDNRLIGRFYRDPELTDIAYVLEATSNLNAAPGDWEVLYDSAIDLQPNADGAYQEIEDSQLLSGFRFFRLRIRLLD